MSRAICLVRQSQGDDDSISLSLQREHVADLADDLADEIDWIDLGVHTGFSIHMKPDADDRIDNHPEMVGLIEDLRSGRYDVLCAYDDTRVARDQYYWEVARAAKLGECRLEYVEPPPDDSMSFRVTRAVESEVKRKEIVKTKRAIEERQERGYYQGRPPFGLQFDDAGQQLVEDPDEWPIVKQVLQQREYGRSYSEIADKTLATKDKVGRIVRNSERYEPYYAGAKSIE